MGEYDYWLRWDDVVYEPGTLIAVTYRKGERWAADTMRTAGGAARLEAKADRSTIGLDGRDLSFVTVRVLDANGTPVPRANNRIRFRIDGPGEIVATDNGDPTSFEPFQSPERAAMNGLCLVIVRAKAGARPDRGHRIERWAAGQRHGDHLGRHSLNPPADSGR
jgi:beta-galactosidase